MIEKMPKKYNLAFKEEAVNLFRDLQQFGYANIEYEQITTVKELCERVGVGTETIYRWNKEIPQTPALPELELDSITPPETDGVYENLDSKELYEIEYPDIETEQTSAWEVVADKVLDDMFGKRFYSWLGRVFQIGDYGNKNVCQTQLEIGLKLIKKSGLVDFDRILKGLKL